MQTSENQIQVNLVSKNNDGEINSFDIDLPDANLFAFLDEFLKDKKILDQFKKLTNKYVKEEKTIKKKSSLLIGSHNPNLGPMHGGFPTGGPSHGGIGGPFNPMGGLNDIDPFGGSNLIGPNSNIFNNPKPFGGQNPNGLEDPDDPMNFRPNPYGLGSTPENDEVPNFPGFKKGGPYGGGPGGGFGGGFGGSGGSSGGGFGGGFGGSGGGPGGGFGGGFG
eukprot:CAMPEP_0205807454 /NCGR_PEP_ID=MMETSP0205-20121125/11181_1 /ASSEMBLY_ACC=CAM_ASM_000278 /TAXON_ID=36767 /ORGANISM="Euplotes focardii, Strain TN1" /LENGTH=219 /DNA_ID=CAMNT_0053081695 /DNA_START=320 /DNA_END=975 /DNA_ORIENTATION=+